MNKTHVEFAEGTQAFQRHPQLPASLPPDKDTDDYEEFEDDAEMMQALWHQGEEAFEDELMASEDY
jgi:hypothetical protein